MRAKRRSWLLLMMTGAAGVRAQAADPPLRPGETIELPGVGIKVLGVDWKRGATITFRLRATAAVDRHAMIDLDAFRLFVAGVPRAPFYATTAEGQQASLLIDKESAIDFTRAFRVPERTDDLVLQVRIEGAVERRRVVAK